MAIAIIPKTTVAAPDRINTDGWSRERLIRELRRGVISSRSGKNLPLSKAKVEFRKLTNQ